MESRIHIVIAALVVACAIGNAANAQDNTAKPPIEAGVQKVHISLSDLRTVGLDLKNVLKATTSLYDEVTIQPMQIIYEPEVIGMGTIIQVPIDKRPSGPVEPARKERVDLAMGQIKPTVQMLKSNVDAFLSGERQLDLPDDVHAQLQPDLDNWVKGVQQIAAQEAQLEQLTQKSPYDQPAIASNCLSMQQMIRTLDETRRSVYKVLKKHAKELGLGK